MAAHPSVPDRDITSEVLVQLYDGKRDTWSDGSRVVVLQRESGDSSHRSVTRVLPAFDEVNRRAYEAGSRAVSTDCKASSKNQSTNNDANVCRLNANVILFYDAECQHRKEQK